MALVVVLWLVVLLSVMAAGHTKNVRTDTLLASRQLEAAAARGLAEAGINHAVYSMLAGRKVPIDGRLFDVTIGDAPVRVSVRDARGLVDLNTADPVLLDALLRAAGVDDRVAIVAAILDWRDADHLPRLDGAEADTYLAAGLPWSPRTGPFAVVDELRYIPGIDASLFARLVPFLTVYSEGAGIDLEFAPPALITAMTGREVAAAVRDASSVHSGTFHIHASVAAGAGTLTTIEAVVRLSGSGDERFRVLAWRAPAHVTIPTREEAG